MRSGGPAPAWVEEDEGQIKRYEYARIADQLVSILEARVKVLQETQSPDVILKEVRKELAACVVEGDLSIIAWTAGLLDELCEVYSRPEL